MVGRGKRAVRLGKVMAKLLLGNGEVSWVEKANITREDKYILSHLL